MSGDGAALFERRLLIVTGKGGVGKTTLAAALGVVACRRGIDTVVIETGNEAAIPGLLGEANPDQAAGDGRNPWQISPHLYTLRIVPEIALAEYLELQLHTRLLVRIVVGNAGFQRLLDAAPGWRELITLGKLWHLESRRDGAKPRWGLLIVDAPSTGHGLSLLAVPNVILDTVRLGPLRRHTDWVQELIHDPARTLVLPVTLPEELPVVETLELRAGVRELGLALGPLFVNGVEPRPCLPQLDPLLDALGGDLDAPGLPSRSALAQILEHSVRRGALQQSFLERLRAEVSEPVVELPYLRESIENRTGIERLADALELSLAEREGEP